MGEAGRRNGQGDWGERSPVDEQLDRASAVTESAGSRLPLGSTDKKEDDYQSENFLVPLEFTDYLFDG